ncbi:MAG: DUF192 domain-containing protein [Thiothrix sp.]|nr:DUF192 domain-containing protein [Thiothrix sp.]HPE62128.1 DUF192 domain-containing protein [Thiolinea sp.]
MNLHLNRLLLWLNLLLPLLLGACATGEPQPLTFAHVAYLDRIPLQVVLFDSPQEREAGLAGVEELPPGSGALFVFEAPHPARFWMQGMHFSLDILFFDEQGQVVRIVHAAPPCEVDTDCPLIRADDVRYVLELPAGQAERLQVSGQSRLEWEGPDPLDGQ